MAVIVWQAAYPVLAACILYEISSWNEHHEKEILIIYRRLSVRSKTWQALECSLRCLISVYTFNEAGRFLGALWDES